MYYGLLQGRYCVQNIFTTGIGEVETKMSTTRIFVVRDERHRRTNWQTVVVVSTNNLAFQQTFIFELFSGKIKRQDSNLSPSKIKITALLVTNMLCVSGAKDFDLDSFDPMKYDDIFMDYSSRLFGGRITVTDVLMKGYSKIKLRGVR